MSGRRFLGDQWHTAQTWYFLLFLLDGKIIALSGIYFLYTLNRQFMQRATEVDGNITRFAAIWSTKTSTDVFWLITFIIMSVTSQNVRLDARIWRDHWRYWSRDEPMWWDNKNCPSAIHPHRKEIQIPSLLLFTVRLSNFIKAKRSHFSYLNWFSKQ